MDFQRGPLELKVSAQHTGMWGQDGMNTANGRLTMNEAWAKLNLGDKWFIQLGRQQLCYDDERILGAYDWNVNGNWHDAHRKAPLPWLISSEARCILVLPYLLCYISKLFLFSRKSISPIIRMPFSLRQGLILSFTITIFLKESSIFTNDWVS